VVVLLSSCSGGPGPLSAVEKRMIEACVSRLTPSSGEYANLLRVYSETSTRLALDQLEPTIAACDNAHDVLLKGAGYAKGLARAEESLSGALLLARLDFESSGLRGEAVGPDTLHEVQRRVDQFINECRLAGVTVDENQ